MTTFLFWLAAANLAVAALTLLYLVRGLSQIRLLREVPPAEVELPPVSVIIPARDEERNIEEALQSVLRQDYPHLEILVVDDRSTDATGRILHRMAAVEPRLNVTRVDDLPPGWLGKNHAMWHGAGRAQGRYLLFSDADVVLEPSTLRRAIGYAVEHDLDLLAANPIPLVPGVLANVAVGLFSICFVLFARPWQARDPQSSAFIGIGAFNLVRAETYDRAGTHKAIRLRVDDDIMLGKLIKKHGGREDMLAGDGMIRVEWYDSLGGLIRGLTKNMFAGLDFRIWLVVVSTLLHLWMFLWPWAAVAITTGAARWLNAATMIVQVVTYLRVGVMGGGHRWQAVLFPLGSLIFLYIVWRSMLLTLIQRGVVWRGTKYPLAELKANRV